MWGFAWSSCSGTYRSVRVLLSIALIVGLLAVLGSDDAGAATPVTIPVTLRETAGVDRTGELVTFGVPVAGETALLDTSGLSVRSASGAALPAQFRVTARWNGTPEDVTRPIRWVLVHTRVDIPAYGSTTVVVTNAVVPGAQTPMEISQTTETLTVDSGAAVWSVPKTDGRLLRSVQVGGQEQIDADATGLVLTTLSGEKLDISGEAEVVSTEVTETGPVATTVHQVLALDDARLRDEAGESWNVNTCFTWLYDCSELHRYRLRVSVWTTFVEGSTAARMRARVENVSVCPVDEAGVKHCALEHSLNSIGWEDLTFSIGLAQPATSWQAGGAGGALQGNVLSYQDSSGEENWDHYTSLAPVGGGGYTPGGWSDRGGSHVAFRGYRTYSAGSVVDSGNRMPGRLAVGGTAAAAVVAKDAWKHYPLALRATTDVIEIGVYPAEFGATFSLRPGERKTHELGVAFGDAAGLAARTHAWVEAPIRWSWDPNLAVTTRALPGFAVVGVEPDYDTWNRATVDVGVSQAHNPHSWYTPSSILEARRTFDHWGKKEAGYLVNDNEARTSTDLSKYQQYQGFLRQSLRTAADPALSDVWWDVAVDANRAQADSGYLVLPHAVQTSLWPGLNLAHCFHDNAENKTYPRGGGFGCDFQGDLAGMVELYWLTGWEPAVDAIEAHARNVRQRADAFSSYDRESRRMGSTIEVLVTAWEFSGDHSFLDSAVRLVDVMAANDGTKYLRCPCPEAPSGQAINSFFAGWLMRSLGRLADAYVIADGPDSPSYAKVRDALVAHADWYVDKVVFDVYSADTGRTETVGPYQWYLNGAGNSDAVSAAYRLMAVDGLALATVHSGNERYRTKGDALFRTVMRMPFYFGGWPQFVYSTINDAGKLALFGGHHIQAVHGSPPPPPNSPPRAALAVTPPGGAAPLTVTFDAAASVDADGSIVTYSFDFDGNGTVDASGVSPTVQHTYASAGAFVAAVTVTDDAGATDTATTTVTVTSPPPPNGPPHAVLAATPPGGVAALAVTFDASASVDSDGSIVTYAFDFDGNGTVDASGVSPTVQHTYASAGAFVAAVTVTDDAGATDTATTTVTVTSPPPPPPSSDWVSVVVRGGTEYTVSGHLVSGDLRVIRDRRGIVSVTGSGSIGAARLAFDVRRVWVFPVYMGSVSVSDPSAGVDVRAPLWAARLTESGGVIRSRSVWVDTSKVPWARSSITWKVRDV